MWHESAIRGHRSAIGQGLSLSDTLALGRRTVSIVRILGVRLPETKVTNIIRQLWAEDGGQDVAEYAVMLAVILVIVIGTVRLIGTNANNVFSQVGSQLSQ